MPSVSQVIFHGLAPTATCRSSEDGTSRNAVRGLPDPHQDENIHPCLCGTAGPKWYSCRYFRKYGRYEEMLMLWLARCLEDASDQPALLAVLRGMLFGLSDQQLWAYKQEVRRISIHESISLTELSENAHPVGARLPVRMYSEWVRTLHARSFSLIVENLGIIPYVSALPAGSVRAGTLVGLMRLVHSDGRRFKLERTMPIDGKSMSRDGNLESVCRRRSSRPCDESA